MHKVWTKDMIVDRLSREDVVGAKMVEKSLLVIYQNQTTDEQLSLLTKHENGIGFNGADATILSSFAQWVMKGEKMGIPEGKRLSHKQREIARKKLKKYAGQLLMVANKKAAQTPVS